MASAPRTPDAADEQLNKCLVSFNSIESCALQLIEASADANRKRQDAETRATLAVEAQRKTLAELEALKKSEAAFEAAVAQSAKVRVACAYALDRCAARSTLHCPPSC
jgi:hypothetical protein